MEYVWFALIGIAAGFLAGQIIKGRGFGLVGNLIVGVLGAFIGGFLSQAMGFAASGLLGVLVVATLGAVVLLFLVGLVRRAA